MLSEGKLIIILGKDEVKMMIDLNRKKILIIGASSGIGEETAYVLAKAGANVILVARREEKLVEVCKKIQGEHKAYYVADISKINSIEELINRIVTENVKLDGLVYVAGISFGDVPIKYLTFERHGFSLKEFVDAGNEQLRSFSGQCSGRSGDHPER